MLLVAVFCTAALILTSCTKVTHSTIVGEWEVLYKSIGFDEAETVIYDSWQIQFFNDNTYVSTNNSEIDKKGYWSYDSSCQELTMNNKTFTADKMEGKVLRLISIEGIYSNYYLKKVSDL